MAAPNMRIFSAILLFVGIVAAQDSPEAWLIPFAAGYAPTTLPAFNNRFAGTTPLLPERQFGWGIELRALASNLLIGPLYMRTSSEATGAGRSVRSDATAIFGTAGLKISPFSFLTLVPAIGIGGLNQSFAIHELSGNTGLDSLLRTPGRSISFSPGTQLAGLAALELCLAVNTTAGRYGLDLRGGYLYSPFNLTWRLSSGGHLTGVPQTHLGGPFATVGIALLPAPVTEPAR